MLIIFRKHMTHNKYHIFPLEKINQSKKPSHLYGYISSERMPEILKGETSFCTSDNLDHLALWVCGDYYVQKTKFLDDKSLPFEDLWWSLDFSMPFNQLKKGDEVYSITRKLDPSERLKFTDSLIRYVSIHNDSAELYNFAKKSKIEDVTKANETILRCTQ